MTEQAAPHEPANNHKAFIRAVRLGKQFSLSAIESAYANPAHPEGVLAYHGVTHSLRIAKDTLAILQTIQQVDGEAVVSNHMLGMGELSGALHDVYQEWYMEPNPPKEDKPLKRKRAYGTSETKAASITRAYMEQYNLACQEPVFTPGDMQLSEEAIHITMASYDGNLKTITQPNFPELKSNLVAAAVALADLGGGGMHGWDTFRWELYALFQEENIDIAKYIDRPERSKRNAVLEAAYMKRFMAWLDFEREFIAGRQIKTMREIDSLSISEAAKAGVKHLFRHYDDCALALTELAHTYTEEAHPFDLFSRDIAQVLANPPEYS